ncbi:MULTISPECIES: RnfABCDGE type electron transport complex subunit D [Peptoniphilus]|uniref:RnfABCDGE type electron transport complex subunit D n=1 Tax=Peptoniphilus TaxID=162289 RepID=UPI0001DA9AA7|nr:MULTISPECIES: RnfABCDGE type electron transport complex subunit D [Peptoniphilus]EFI41985.1 electron transport complex, RnfABCDGE type, D subunit [Peptoniphilus sp. oral taxon 386 str. F0131]
MENKKIVKEPATLKGNEFFVSLAPHLRSKDSVQRIMLDVIIALIPALAGSVYFFGLRALMLVMICVISCVATEYVFQKFMHKEIQIADLSAVVTGILIAFNLPATAPWWMAAFGSIFSIAVVKECFGGIGCNFMNPALAARIVIMASWAKKMTDYVAPVRQVAVDAATSATPLQLIKAGDFTNLPALKDMIIGNISGVIGETSAILLLIGGIYLVVRGVINFRIPLVYVITTIVFLFIFGIPAEIIPYEVFGGGLFLGAIFMATDYTTTPMNNRGKIIFALGCGIITAVIRVKGSLPEGVSYSICLMNVATPLIDKLTRTSAYGEAK